MTTLNAIYMFCIADFFNSVVDASIIIASLGRGRIIRAYILGMELKLKAQIMDFHPTPRVVDVYRYPQNAHSGDLPRTATSDFWYCTVRHVHKVQECLQSTTDHNYDEFF